MVFEMGTNSLNTEGGQYHALIRKHPSMNLDGSYSSTDSGYSYFPGYAMDLETGERLNIAFGEDSRYPSENGADMKWNPTSNLGSFDNTGTFNLAAGETLYLCFWKQSSYVDTIPSATTTLFQAIFILRILLIGDLHMTNVVTSRAALWNLPNVQHRLLIKNW